MRWSVMIEREKILENLIILLPSMFKSIMRKFSDLDMSKQQIGLLHRIFSCNGETMSYYSDKMSIPKSNLTVLADKLIKEGLVKRESDNEDRRIVNLVITDRGIEKMKTQDEIFKKKVNELFANLNDEDIVKLNSAIYEMKSVLDKL